ncbi:hypothetical protein GE061_013644 [Apolygus lucorum]|uniref:Uncharacterized protein n=1 Tax=Apolygus lucorum TaxID=248454 RepID=A0A8S9XQM0_APOLU|nr:hypothetical protein GE061_013644 [Apolygus lucorum]
MPKIERCKLQFHGLLICAASPGHFFSGPSIQNVVDSLLVPLKDSTTLSFQTGQLHTNIAGIAQKLCILIDYCPSDLEPRRSYRIFMGKVEEEAGQAVLPEAVVYR